MNGPVGSVLHHALKHVVAEHNVKLSTEPLQKNMVEPVLELLFGHGIATPKVVQVTFNSFILIYSKPSTYESPFYLS